MTIFRIVFLSFFVETLFSSLSCQIDSGILAKKLGVRSGEFNVQINRGVEMQTAN